MIDMIITITESGEGWCTWEVSVTSTNRPPEKIDEGESRSYMGAAHDAKLVADEYREKNS